MSRLVVATTNHGKLREIEKLLDGIRFNLVTLADWPGVAPPEETGRTFAENARLKAVYYAQHTGELTVAEDSGLEIDALGGAPGVESARFGGASSSYSEKFALLYDALRAKKAAGSTARFVCTLALARGGDVALRNAGHRRRHNRAGAEGLRWLRLRSDFFLPAIWVHAGGSEIQQKRPSRTAARLSASCEPI